MYYNLLYILFALCVLLRTEKYTLHTFIKGIECSYTIQRPQYQQLQVMILYCLKRQYHKIFYSVFFHPTTSPEPSYRHAQKLFRNLSNINGVTHIQIRSTTYLLPVSKSYSVYLPPESSDVFVNREPRLPGCIYHQGYFFGLGGVILRIFEGMMPEPLQEQSFIKQTACFIYIYITAPNNMIPMFLRK